MLWKEWRERRWWALAWAAGLLGVSLFAGGQTFYGEDGVTFTNWHAASWVPALLCGLAAYAPESRQELALFLFSRPVPWGRVLLGKVLFGLIVAVGAPLLAALFMKLCGPAPYRPYVTLDATLAGAWTIMWPHTLIYLFGLGVSTLLPGMAGGVLALAGVAVVLAGLIIVGQLHYTLATAIVIFLAVVTAGVSLARYGLTLDVSARLKRYLARLAVVVLLGIGIGLPVAIQGGERLLQRRAVVNTLISPRGTHALVFSGLQWRHLGYITRSLPWRERPGMTIIRCADGKVLVAIPPVGTGYNVRVDDHTWHWASDDVAYADVRWATGGDMRTITVFTPARGLHSIDIGDWQTFFDFSPDGRYLLLHQHKAWLDYVQRDSSNVENRYALLDLRTERIISDVLTLRFGTQVFWHSATELAYAEFHNAPIDPRKPHGGTQRVFDRLRVVRVLP
jgi:hypothetical protein